MENLSGIYHTMKRSLSYCEIHLGQRFAKSDVNQCKSSRVTVLNTLELTKYDRKAGKTKRVTEKKYSHTSPIKDRKKNKKLNIATSDTVNVNKTKTVMIVQ